MSGFKPHQKVKMANEPDFWGDGFVIAYSEMGDHRDVLWMGDPGNPESAKRQVVTTHIGNMIEVDD